MLVPYVRMSVSCPSYEKKKRLSKPFDIECTINFLLLIFPFDLYSTASSHRFAALPSPSIGMIYILFSLHLFYSHSGESFSVLYFYVYVFHSIFSPFRGMCDINSIVNSVLEHFNRFQRVVCTWNVNSVFLSRCLRWYVTDVLRVQIVRVVAKDQMTQVAWVVASSVFH